ncbi:DNA polymerase [uncultured Sulfitobacter sp.]|uniref:DNA polymerase n=1 Tax=uncultured Sulfitobacter sp. TaxID=191468 RepID=UPI002595F843|nr:DNA polymerase [uncultured Sulfitobacter sp.]
MTVQLHMDHETKCDLDLLKVGLDKYANHPSCGHLMTSFAFGNDEPELWDRSAKKKMPSHLADALHDDDVEIWAFNAQFERIINKLILGIDVDVRRYYCVMALAYMHSYTGNLGDVGAAAGLPEGEQKLKEGKRLIRKFSMPQRVTKNQPHLWRDHTTDPEDWALFGEYCCGDTVAERGIHKRLAPFYIDPQDWEMYWVDQIINDRGIPIDMTFVENAIRLADRRKAQLLEQMQDLTGLENPNSPQQLQSWLRDRGYWFRDLQKATIVKVLNENDDPENEYYKALEDEAVAALKLRQQSARTSTSKYNAVQTRIGDDGRLRYTLQFAGASRTLRWAGRGMQIQNLPGTPGVMEEEDGSDYILTAVTETIREGDADMLDLWMEEPLDALSGLVRSSIRAEEGQHILACDLASIESCVIGWVSKCNRLLNVFRSGKDAYKDFATDFYGVDYDYVTKVQRKKSKPAVLGCFGADTQVLTLRGWRPITSVGSEDCLWDGRDWCRSDGVISRGNKPVFNFHGVEVTSDHLVLVAEDKWEEAWDVNQNTLLERQAFDLANGLCCGLLEKTEAHYITDVSVVAERCKTFTHRIWKEGKVNPVFLVRTGLDENKRTEFMSDSRTEAGRMLTGWLTDTTQLCRDAGTNKVTQVSATLHEESSVDSEMFMIFLNTFSPWKAGTDAKKKLIESITTVTTNGAILGSRTTGHRIVTKNAFGGSFIGMSACVLQSSMNDLRLRIGMSQLWHEKLEKGKQRKRLLSGSETAVVPTYDIANCGPRSRFTILTDKGPLIVHNCGYRLGGGELKFGKKTGLWGYAENMGIMLTREESQDAVDLWRSAYPEIPKAWYAYEDAVIKVVRTKKPIKVNMVEFSYEKPYLVAKLPSGRNIYYKAPRIEKRTIKYRSKETGKMETFEKDNLTYMGKQQNGKKWVRLDTHGGKLIENFVQAIARDILRDGLLACHHDGFDISFHVHDEIVAIENIDDEYYTLDRMRELMIGSSPWAKGLPLGASGFYSSFYKKD